MSVQLRRIPVPLVAGGINDASADQGGMGPYDNLELKNGVWQTPSSVGIRRGSYLSADNYLDDQGSPAAVTSLQHLDYWEGAGVLIVLGHSTTTDKHYLYTALGDGSGPTRYGMPAAYAVAAPVLFSTAGWFGDRFYGCDIGQTLGMWKFNTSSVAVYQADGANTAKPLQLFTHRNHLFMVGTARDGTVVPDRLTYSDIGAPDTVNTANFIDVGNDAEPLTGGVSLGEYAIVFKDNEAYLLAGSGRQSWTLRPLDLDRGCIGPRAMVRYGGYVWFISNDGPARISPGGKSELLVDRVRQKWSQLDNLDQAFVAVDPDRRLVLFGVHEIGVAGTAPRKFLAVDERTGAWSELDYNFAMAHAGPVKQGANPAPAGPPTYVAESNVAENGWTANWTNGDTRTGTSTRHESQDVDAGGSFAEDKEAEVPATSTAITGKVGGTHYKERVRHERFGIYSAYSAEGDVYTKCETPTIDAIGNGVSGQILITVLMSAGNNDGAAGQVDVERCGDSGGPDGNWVNVHTFSPLNGTGCESWIDTGRPNGTKFWYRAVTSRPPNHAASGYSEVDDGTAGAVELSLSLC